MKTCRFLLLSCLLACSPCTGGEPEEKHEPKTIVSPGKTLSIRQQYQGNFSEILSFPGKDLDAVHLDDGGAFSFPWPAEYHFSPDEQWLLRIQKTGSGTNIALLYRIEGNGRVSQVTGFDKRLWTESDKVSKLKEKDLFHTGVEEVTWSADSKALVLRMKGSAVDQSHRDKGLRSMEVVVTCDLAGNRFRAEPVSS